MDLQRYASQMAMPNMGLQGQLLMQQAKVLVVGAGGLGCPVLCYLAGMGIGTIGIVDDDTVKPGNLHRQVLYTEADIGQLKTVAAKQRLLAQNSTIEIALFPERLTMANAAAIMAGFDLLIDCTDNMAARYTIDDTAHQLGKPWVYGAVLQHEGQVAVFNYKDGPRYRHLFPDPSLFNQQENCAVAGIMGHTCGLVGCLQANEAVKLLLHSEHTINGFLLTVDLQTLAMRKWKVKAVGTQ